jgi:hypothetical protein
MTLFRVQHPDLQAIPPPATPSSRAKRGDPVVRRDDWIAASLRSSQ